MKCEVVVVEGNRIENISCLSPSYINHSHHDAPSGTAVFRVTFFALRFTTPAAADAAVAGTADPATAEVLARGRRALSRYIRSRSRGVCSGAEDGPSFPVLRFDLAVEGRVDVLALLTRRGAL